MCSIHYGRFSPSRKPAYIHFIAKAIILPSWGALYHITGFTAIIIPSSWGPETGEAGRSGGVRTTIVDSPRKFHSQFLEILRRAKQAEAEALEET